MGAFAKRFEQRNGCGRAADAEQRNAAQGKGFAVSGGLREGGGEGLVRSGKIALRVKGKAAEALDAGRGGGHCVQRGEGFSGVATLKLDAKRGERRRSLRPGAGLGRRGGKAGEQREHEEDLTQCHIK